MIQDTNGRRRQHPLARAGEVFLFWIPVMVPLILLGQLGTPGLRPAQKKVHELKEDDRALDEQLTKNKLRRRELEEKLSALTDPIYRHRHKRRMNDRAGGARSAPEPNTIPARNR